MCEHERGGDVSAGGTGGVPIRLSLLRNFPMLHGKTPWAAIIVLTRGLSYRNILDQSSYPYNQ